MAHAKLLGQTLQGISQVLKRQQQQGAHQQDWLQRNFSLFKMPCMTKGDDPEAYIKAFELTSLHIELDRFQWAHQLGTLVTDKVQVAYQAFSREEACNYDTVKAAILHRLEINPKNYRLSFRACKACKEQRPRILIQYLRDVLNKWLPPGCMIRIE